MSQPFKSVLKDAGAAIAVLSIYLLTLLIPLHQANATQAGFAELGYAATDAWVLCQTPADADGGTDGADVAICDLTGVNKHNLSLAAPGGAVLAASPTATPVDYNRTPPFLHAFAPSSNTHSRAPPTGA